ncbi:MAG TPA: vitamin K epoxide reductase family protein [Candidatus Limnocylindrales bacterium]|jgi:uncharacterized membrane protein
MADSPTATGTPRRSLWRRIRSIHPAFVLAALDLIGLGIASYLAITELTGGTVVCGALKGCEQVQNSPYTRPFAGIPVAVYGVILSITLFTLAIAWWRTGNYKLLLAHYGLSLVGVAFEGWFQFAQIFLIRAVCVWCESYGASLVLRFVVALWVYLHTPNPDQVAIDEPA